MSVVAYVNAGTSVTGVNASTLSANSPASGIQVGDLLVAIAGGLNNSGATVFTWSTGWTPISTSYASNYAVTAAYKIATSADVSAPPTATLTANTVGMYFGMQVFQYRNAVGIGAFAIAASSVAADTTPGYTTLAADSTDAYFSASYSASGNTTPTGFTQDSRVVNGSTETTAGHTATNLGGVGTVVPALSFNRATYGGTVHVELLAANYSISSLSPPTAFGGFAYQGTQSSGKLQTITASGLAEQPPTIQNITASGTAMTNTLGTSTASIASMTGTSSGAEGVVGSEISIFHTLAISMTGESRFPNALQLFKVAMTGTTGVAGGISVSPQMFVQNMVTWPTGGISATLQAATVVVAGATGQIGAIGATTQLFSLAMTGYVQVNGSINVALLPLRSEMSGVAATGSTYSTVSMHTEWQGLVSYTNFNFNSYTKFNNQYLAAGDGGLFALTGDTDNGVQINSVARTGITDMGTSHLKRVDYVYAGYRTMGSMMLRVITNDLKTRDYKMASTGETGLHVKRIYLARGVDARYWQFEIQNVNGADFKLDCLEIKPTVLSRRIQGGRA